MVFTLWVGKTSVFRRENGNSTVSRTITYRYNKLGELSYKKDSKTGLATTYFYDTYGRNIGMYENTDSPNASTLAAHRLRYVYDGLGRMETSTETYDGLLYTTAYAYNTNGQVNEVSAGKATQRYKYDNFERLTQSYIYHDGSYSYLLAKTVNYKSGTAGTSNQISSLVYEDSAENTIIYTYAYDANGNISSEKVGSYTTTYVYDSANQLIRENNQKAGKTWVWTYDAAGNILSKKQYAYTTGTLGSVQSTITYTYGNANWKDLLTNYNGARITYDNVGNPLTYGAEQKYTWEQGRQLSVLMQATDFAVAKQPKDFVGQIGDRITFTVEVCGTGPFTYQWQAKSETTDWGNSTAGGYNTASMFLYMTQNTPKYMYRCKITDANGKVIYSEPGKIINAPIVVDAQPEDFYGNVGDTATFSIAARGTGLSYQWQVSSKGTSWDNSTAPGYTTNGISLTVKSYHIGYYYRCKITDSSGNVTYSEPGRIYPDELTVVTQPEDSMVNVGDLARFAIEAHGTGLTYQWQVSSNRGASWIDSTANGCTTPSISLTVLSYHPGYYYRCKVTDSEGNVVFSEPGEVLLPLEKWTYTYNADGMRTERTNGTTTYKYTYHGSQLTHMDYNGTKLHFSYDASGSPMAVVYGGNTYYYLLNQQGDVVAILNSSGTQVVAYTYDAWGRPLSTTGTMASTLGLYNPLRYRGYVYDRETGLYYLQSRYYNPNWGRFLNADALVSTGQGVLGNNMFAYCNNNPVMFSDPAGESITIATLIFIGSVIIGLGCASYTAYQEYEAGFDTVRIIGDSICAGFAGFSIAYSGGMSLYQCYQNFCYLNGLTPVTEIGVKNTAQQLQTCANTANSTVSGTGAVAGTKKHTVFANEVNNLGNPNLRTEVSYLNGQEVNHGMKGSIRFDVLQFGADGTPIAAWDLKTGAAILTDTRITQMLERSGLNIPIFMIK